FGKGVDRMTDEQLRKIYFPLAESWKLIRQYADATGTIVECFKVQEQAQMIFEKAEKTKFSEEIFTDPGDVVIDPCAGSGSTLRAAHELGRSAFGFEIDRTFFGRAKKEMLN